MILKKKEFFLLIFLIFLQSCSGGRIGNFLESSFNDLEKINKNENLQINLVNKRILVKENEEINDKKNKKIKKIEKPKNVPENKRILVKENEEINDKKNKKIKKIEKPKNVPENKRILVKENEEINDKKNKKIKKIEKPKNVPENKRILVKENEEINDKKNKKIKKIEKPANFTENKKGVNSVKILKQNNKKIKNSTKKRNIDLQSYKIIFILKDVDPKDPTAELSSILSNSEVNFEIEKIERILDVKNKSMNKN